MRTPKMHDDELDVDVPLVRRLLARQFPHWADLPLERVASTGTVNALFRLGPTMAVRLPLTPRFADDVARERRMLRLLTGRLPVPVPTVLGRGEPAGAYPLPWSVTDWLPGEPPREGRLADPEGLADQLAALVRAFRSLTLPDATPAYRGGPLAVDDAAIRASLGRIDALGLPVDTRAATEAWEASLAAPPPEGPPVWAHADLMPSNLLVAGGRLAAVLDVATAGLADPACDLVPAWNLLPPGARDRFRAAVGVDDATWLRGRGKALAMALPQLPYYHETNPGIAANARHVIAQVLADHARGGPFP
ncbi:aminoglycoside phosphotransferase family protein [Streptomyces radicis]|uniref:Aminoglycoside phosphotransferase family protein n=1 Tax=Streptomyces radicis TaxID=1750517 RepID=A0A3A9W0K6_9ACTN|nr:aminoglycoside phosphotransferase family protein [Streptomyces radicis]RKN06282.1 aminoglycoside phosphotransferase family protein [Streptomyces radicis]RKN18612.1 aminoglycoside phosphotransferase family protein [Streptomyces radicis]